MRSEILCKGCGRLRGHDDQIPTPDHCDKCPPWRCDKCGEMDSMASPCSCWVSLMGMPMADIKALFAAVDMGLTHHLDLEEPNA